MRRPFIRRDTPTEGAGGQGGQEGTAQGQDPGTQIPGEGTTLSPEEQQQANIETAARAKGWKPEEEWQGDPGTHIGAKEFLAREPLFDRIKTQSKELKGLRKTVEAMVNQHTTAVNAEVARRLKELKAEKKEAIELGDVDKVEEIDAQIDEQKAATANPPQPANTEVDDWIERNPWFKTDPELNDFAIAYNKASFEKTQDVMDSLRKTEEAVKKAFPEKFNSDTASGKKENKQAIDPVAGSGQPSSGEQKGGYNISRLTEEQKLVYNQHVKVHKLLSHEEFFKGLEEIGELS